MKKVALGIIATIGLSTASQAADMAVKARPIPVVVYNWSGWYIGGNAGATVGQSQDASTQGSVISDPNLSVPAGNGPFLPGIGNAIATSTTNQVPVRSPLAAIAGVQIGYNYQFSSWVVGLEADIQGVFGKSRVGVASSTNNIGATFGGLAQPIPFPTTSTVSVSKQVNYLGTVRGRLGYTMTPTFLAYVTGGLAYGGVESTTIVSTTATTQNNQGNFGVTNVTGSTGHLSQTRFGFTVGAGGEWMVSNNWSVKAEYLYYNLGRASYNGGTSTATNTLLANAFGLTQPFAVTSVQTRPLFDGHIARIGINYHFDYGPVVARY